MPIDDRINTSGTQTDRVSEDWSKAASSFNMLEQHLQQPSQKLDLGYDPIIGGIGPMFEQNLPFINELSTATDFDDGEFRTNHNSYFIFREDIDMRSEEPTYELQSLMRISYAYFCLKTKNITY